MRLTEQQARYFHSFGFLKFPGLFATEADLIVSAFEEIWESHGGGHHGSEHDRKRRSALLPFIDKNEFLCSLIDDPRIDGVASSLLGDDYNYSASDGNYYVGDTHWHSDMYRETKYLSFKIAFYLDSVAMDTGCLRVIPGSHHLGDAYGDSLQPVAKAPRPEQAPALWGVHGSEVPSVPLQSEPGDMVLFNHRTKHASFGGGSQRRMFTINFQQRFADEDLPELRDEISGLARFWHSKPYGDLMIDTAGTDRMRHLEQRLANSDHLPQLVDKAKQEMAEPARG